MSIEIIKDLSSLQWRDSSGIYYDIKQMESRHLFNTLKMIWNHSAPEHLKIKPYKKHVFMSFYDKIYLKKVIKAMRKELESRPECKNIVGAYFCDTEHLKQRILRQRR